MQMSSLQCKSFLGSAEVFSVLWVFRKDSSPSWNLISLRILYGGVGEAFAAMGFIGAVVGCRSQSWKKSSKRHKKVLKNDPKNRISVVQSWVLWGAVGLMHWGGGGEDFLQGSLWFLYWCHSIRKDLQIPLMISISFSWSRKLFPDSNSAVWFATLFSCRSLCPENQPWLAFYSRCKIQ